MQFSHLFRYIPKQQIQWGKYMILMSTFYIIYGLDLLTHPKAYILSILMWW